MTMSESEETYCRLCAEPTPLEQLISTDDDVGLYSKITSKMLWINVDVSTTNTLPKTICFSCFDLLERTWAFLHNVRTAQQKLNEVFQIKVNIVDNGSNSKENTSKPVDKNWEEFEDTKTMVKCEDSTNNHVNKVDQNDVMNRIKPEPIESDHDNTYNNSFGDSSDSDMPLKLAAKKKKVKTKKKKKTYDEEMFEADLDPNSTAEVIPMDISMYTLTWEDLTWCCANCDAQCKTIDSLRIHSLEIHNQCCSFKCLDCGKTIQNYRSFISHVRLHYKSLRYHCEICNKHFKMYALVKKHRQQSHKNVLKHLCKSCGFNFDNEELLDDHVEIYTKRNRRKKTEIKVKEETLDNDLKCEACGRQFKSRSNLQAHKLVHTARARNFSCHVCGKMFFTKGALSTHMATHEDSKPFKCAFCPMAFRARGNLTSHITLHSGTKPFVCEQCGKSFRVKRHLKSHSIVHTDLMPYVCEYCNKSFRFKTRLNLHVRQHTGAKPYTCVYCRRDFTNGSNYKKHMKRRHNIDTSVRKKFNTIVDNQILEISVNGSNNTQS